MAIFRRKTETKDAEFEAWVAQQGTQFLANTTVGWPVIDVSPGLLTALGTYDAGTLSYSAIYRSIPAVYTVVDFLSKNIAQIGIKVYRRVSDDEREHLQDSPITDILASPAPGLTYTQFMHRTVADVCIYGNCYWAKLDAPVQGQGRSKVLTPLPAAAVSPRGGTLIKADQYDVTLGSNVTSFPAEDVVHFRTYNPDDMRIGVSPLEPLRAIIREEAAASAYREVFLRKGARIEGILTRPADAGPWDETTRSRFREAWRRFARGGNREGETAVLEDGMDYKPASFSPKDAEFLAGRKAVLEAVTRAYGVPLSVLGLTETATYASQREFQRALYRDTLAPWTRLIEDQIDAELVPWFTADPDVYVEFTVEEKLRLALEDAAAMLLQAGGGPYMTRNEVRARLNLSPIEDPDADRLVLTNNMVGTETNAPEIPAPPETAPPSAPAAAAAVVNIADRASKAKAQEES